MATKKIAKTTTKRVRKPSTPEQRAARRAKRWRKTGVSEATVQWMKDNHML